MKSKFNFFYLLIFMQLQLDLLFFNWGLQGLLSALLFLMIYPKKQNYISIGFTLLAFNVEKFITEPQLLGLNWLLIMTSFLICQILKRNIIFKNLIFYLALICYLILNNYLACIYIFKTNLVFVDLDLNIILNLIYSLFMIKLFNTFYK